MHVISEGVNPPGKPIREPHFSLIENFLSHLGILKSTPRLYEASMDEQTILPRPPLLSREGQLPKRPRALTATNTEPSLPPHRRKKAPPLPTTKAFMFSGVHPNYTRHALDEEDDSPLVDDEEIVIQRREEPVMDPKLIYRLYNLYSKSTFTLSKYLKTL